ncbi:dermatopontin-like [Mercenaria mercenaria]|uniref:dermatopontin-like n=1 Tax=Mercenaria mercenaria TaxID=6596 RepID=UPI00234F3691|nr:dermatopontin-like [Mercenaria mercenaria]
MMLRLVVLKILPLFGIFIPVIKGSLNQLDRPLNFKCPNEYQHVSRVKSDHDNAAEDRTFDMNCTDVDKGVENLSVTCAWTDWQNDFDSLLAFECANNGYINGMKSFHDNNAEDRRWGFHCCELAGIHLFDCKLTDWTNDWDHHQDYSLPAGYVMRGVFSIHDNSYEDRRYKYEICKVAWGEI